MSWILATLIASATQIARNAAQRSLIADAGTMGATAVRFIFGLPFAVLFLALGGGLGGIGAVTPAGIGWTLTGAASQIAATALLLAVIELRGFGVATALIKTEPASLVLIAWLVLGQAPGAARFVAIAVAVAGVLLASATDWRRAVPLTVLAGIASGALFGIASLAFREAITALHAGGTMQRAGTILVLTLAAQSAFFVLWFLGPGRAAVAAIRREIAASFGAGFLGAASSQMLFIAFALAPAADVRTLGLVEIPLAAIVSRRVFAEAVSARQLAGMGLVVAGIALLIRAA